MLGHAPPATRVLARGATDGHVPVCKPPVTGARSLVSTETRPRRPCTCTCTRTHARNPAHSRNTCLPSSCSAHTSPPLPAQPGSATSASPHMHVLGQMLTSRRRLASTCLCSSPDLSVVCSSDREGKGQANLWPQSEAAHFSWQQARPSTSRSVPSHQRNVRCYWDPPFLTPVT